MVVCVRRKTTCISIKYLFYSVKFLIIVVSVDLKFHYPFNSSLSKPVLAIYIWALFFIHLSYSRQTIIGANKWLVNRFPFRHPIRSGHPMRQHLIRFAPLEPCDEWNPKASIAKKEQLSNRLEIALRRTNTTGCMDVGWLALWVGSPDSLCVLSFRTLLYVWTCAVGMFACMQHWRRSRRRFIRS